MGQKSSPPERGCSGGLCDWGKSNRGNNSMVSGVVHAALIVAVGRPIFLSECLETSHEARASLFHCCHGDLLRGSGKPSKTHLPFPARSRSDRRHKSSFFQRRRFGDREISKTPGNGGSVVW